MTILNLIDQLIRDEGLRVKPYRDSVGKLTIGVGRNLDDVGISKDEAAFLLHNDIRAAEDDLGKALAWTTNLDPIRRAVLVNMTFNMGIGGVLGFKKMLASIQAGNFEQAADEMQNSAWSEQVGPRAARLAKQMASGEWQ